MHVLAAPSQVNVHRATDYHDAFLHILIGPNWPLVGELAMDNLTGLPMRRPSCKEREPGFASDGQSWRFVRPPLL